MAFPDVPENDVVKKYMEPGDHAAMIQAAIDETADTVSLQITNAPPKSEDEKIQVKAENRAFVQGQHSVVRRGFAVDEHSQHSAPCRMIGPDF